MSDISSKRKDIGPDLHKRKFRQKMPYSEAKAQLKVVMNLIEQQKELEDKTKHIDNLINGIVEAYGCTNLNHLLSVLSVRGGGKIPVGVQVKD